MSSILGGGGGGSATLATSNLNFYVATTGSDSNPGTLAQPFATILNAVTVASKFDYQLQFFPTINVAAGSGGSYALDQTNVLPNLINAVSAGFIIGAGTGSTIIQTATQTPFKSVGDLSNWIIKTLTIDTPFLGISATKGSKLSLTTIEFRDSTAGGNLECVAASSIATISFDSSTFTITPSSFLAFTESGGNGSVACNHSTIVLQATSSAFAWIISTQGDGGCTYFFDSVTYTNGGGFSGKNVDIAASGGLVFVLTQNGTFADIPGTTGTFDNSSYIGKTHSPIGSWGSLLNAGMSGAQPNAYNIFKDTVHGGVFVVYNDSTNGSNFRYTQIGRFVNAQTGASYTMTLADSDGRVTMNNAGANTFTVPQDSSFQATPQVGTECRVTQIGAGLTTIAAGAGATVNNAGALSGQWGSALVVKISANTWVQTSV